MFFLQDLPTQEMLEKYKAQYPMMQPDKLYGILSFLRRASHIIRDLDQFFAQYDLSQTRFYCLILLDREAEGCKLTSMMVAEKLNVTKVVVSKTAKSLRDQGYIRFEDNPSDRRSSYLVLTREGRDKLHSVLPDYYDFMNQIELED